MNIQQVAFPQRRSSSLPSSLANPGASGLALRDANDTDLPYLRRLYAASRSNELAAFPWPDQAKQAFCDSQFDLQHRHYVSHYISADFLIVLRDGMPIGRLYLHRTAQELRLVDILLDEATRGQGLGSTLLRWLQSQVRAHAGASLVLHVQLHNERARRLYERHGFVIEGAHGDTYLRMRWHPENAEKPTAPYL